MVDANPFTHHAADAWRLSARRWAASTGAAVRRTLRNRRTRRHLSMLDDDRLCDVGISPQSAEREVRKSFPLHRRP